MSRPETGVMQFGNDWPGVFLRGDDANYYAFILREIIEIFGKEMHPIMGKEVLQSLHDTLVKCDTRNNPDPQLLKSFEECLDGTKVSDNSENN